MNSISLYYVYIISRDSIFMVSLIMPVILMELPKFLWQEWLNYEEIVVNEERGLIEQK